MRIRLPRRTNRSRHTNLVRCIGSSCFEIRYTFDHWTTLLELLTIPHDGASHVMYSPLIHVAHPKRYQRSLPPSAARSDGKNVLFVSTGEAQEPKTCLLGHRKPIDVLIWLHNSWFPTSRADYIQATKASASKPRFQSRRLAFQPRRLQIPDRSPEWILDS